MGDPDLFRPLYDALLTHDEYMLLADYRLYIECQERVSTAYGIVIAGTECPS